jgi:hypothetical protein
VKKQEPVSQVEMRELEVENLIYKQNKNTQINENENARAPSILSLIHDD